MISYDVETGETTEVPDPPWVGFLGSDSPNPMKVNQVFSITYVNEEVPPNSVVVFKVDGVPTNVTLVDQKADLEFVSPYSGVIRVEAPGATIDLIVEA